MVGRGPRGRATADDGAANGGAPPSRPQARPYPAADRRTHRTSHRTTDARTDPYPEADPRVDTSSKAIRMPNAVRGADHGGDDVDDHVVHVLQLLHQPIRRLPSSRHVR